MMMLTPFLIMILTTLVYCKKRHQSYIRRKYNYRMFALRDKLRLLGLKGEIDPHSAIFEYYDKSFSKHIKQSYYLTLPGMTTIYYKHKNDAALFARHAWIDEETNKFPALVDLKKSAANFTAEYIIHQEVLFHCIYWISMMVFRMRWLKVKIQTLIDSLYWMPETSPRLYRRHEQSAIC